MVGHDIFVMWQCGVTARREYARGATIRGGSITGIVIILDLTARAEAGSA